MTRKTWRDRLQHIAGGFVLTAAFPHLFHLLNWPSRVGPRGFIAHVAFNTLLLFAIRTWLFPIQRRAEERIRAAHKSCANSSAASRPKTRSLRTSASPASADA